MTGIVVTGARNHYLVDSGGGKIFRCGIKGKKIRTLEGWYNALASGDRVDLEMDDLDSGKAQISALMPRRNVFRRFNEKGKADQAIAANLDLLVCVTSPGMPPFRPRFIDRVCVVAERDCIPVLVLLNKCDLKMSDEEKLRLDSYHAIGYSLIRCSSKTGEGIAMLRDAVDGRTVAFVGQSGVGKSSVLNALEEGLSHRVGEICEKYERGRHTTTAAILVTLSDGRTRIVDTPGFRRLAVRGIPLDALSACFPEFRRPSESCIHGFRCQHGDEPGCAVLEAVSSGIIHEDRYESYLRIRDELLDTVEYAKKKGKPRINYGDEDE